MRTSALIFVVGIVSAYGAQSYAQSSTGLASQQVSCPSGGTTTLSGIVYAPNGTDPLPNVVVYIPNAPVDAFTAGVACPVPGQPPSGSPLVGTTTATDGSFTLTNVPVGSNIPLVIQSGRWRRQVVIPGTVACQNTPVTADLTRMPRNKSEGDIPKIAIATGSVDQVECVLRKVGLDSSEFTNPMGTGRINLFSGDGSSNSGGARIDSTTPTESTLMGNTATLNQYDVLMLPCEGGAYTRSATQLANLIKFANAGGRVYSSHFAYSWMFQNPPFDGVANWLGSSRSSINAGAATVNTTFSDGQTLADWLQEVGASSTRGQIVISTIKHDLNGVIAPTQAWLTLNTALDSDPNPVMQFTFNAPVGATTNQCGRVLFNEYHVETSVANSNGLAFPNECSTGAMTPQEKLLEYSLFALTDDGGGPTLAPTSANFGSQAVGFSTAPQKFTWKNNSTFPLLVSSATVSGDYAVTSNPCGSVAAGASCEIDVAFKPTAIGSSAGTLTVVSAAKTLTATLTGIGIPDLAASATSLAFGSVDIGASVTKVFTITNNAPGLVPVPPLVLTGDYSATSTCGTSLGSSSSCAISVVFTPTATGARNGILTVNSTAQAYSGLSAALTGNGVDFGVVFNPVSGATVAGNGTTPALTLSPIAGFASQITLRCTTTAPASTCTPSPLSIVPTATTNVTVTITTTSRYTVVGYSGVGDSGLLSLIVIGSGWALWMRRRSAGPLARICLSMLFLAAASLLTTGCSGKYPDLNNPYTLPGTYSYTLTASDGTLTHSATYTLNVTSK